MCKLKSERINSWWLRFHIRGKGRTSQIAHTHTNHCDTHTHTHTHTHTCTACTCANMPFQGSQNSIFLSHSRTCCFLSLQTHFLCVCEVGNDPGQFLGSYVINQMRTICLVQRLSWVFANQDKKKKKTILAFENNYT